MKIKIKKLHEDAVIPTYSKFADAGMDLTATSKIFDKDGNVVYGTGLAFEIPTGFVGLLFPRSSNAKQDLLLSNSVGVLDSGYRGEVFFKFKPTVIFADVGYGAGTDGENFDFITMPDQDYLVRTYNVRDRIGQIIILPYPEVEFEEVQELQDSERGTGGYGSTGV